MPFGRPRLIPTDERLVRHDVASPRTFDQLGVGLSVASLVFQWTALHGQPWWVHRAGVNGSAHGSPRDGGADRRLYPVDLADDGVGEPATRRLRRSGRAAGSSQDVDERGNEQNGN